MAKRSADNQYREVRRGILSGDSTEFSLESILAEFRDIYDAEEESYIDSPAAPEPEEYPPEDELRPEEEYEEYSEEYEEAYDDEYADEYEEEFEEEYADEYDEEYDEELPAEEDIEEGYDEYEEYPDDEDVKIYHPADQEWDEPEDDDVKIYAPDREYEEEPEEELPPMDSDPELTLVLHFDDAEELAEETVEGYEDDGDFYAGPVEEEPALDEEARQEAAEERRRLLNQGGLFRQLMSSLTHLLALATGKRLDPEDLPPEPEECPREMPPRNAAKFYARQMQSLRMRALGASTVALLLGWLTLAYGHGWSLPGGLENDIKLASMFFVVSLITVMLLGLDVVTSGVMALFRGKPSGETLIVLACLTSIADAVAAVVTDGGGRGIGYGVIPAVAMVMALWAGWHSCRGYKHTFLALHHARDPYTVSCETIPERKHSYLIKSRHSTEGFLRRSEEPNAGEMLSALAAPWLTLLALVLTLVVILVRQEPGAFFHVFAMMTAVSVSFLWLLSFPLFFSRSARHLMMNGSAIAGWAGACEIGEGRHLILTDTDVFPDGTVELVGVRLTDKSKAEQVVSVTGSLLSAAGVGLAAVFTELMRRSDLTMTTVEEFTAGEGGISAIMDDVEVQVGSAGYMHFIGVKIPGKMKHDDALYTAIGGKLEGVFLLNYRVSAGVQRALTALRRSRRTPIFAMRDFNIDPMLIHKKFGISSEGFEFPSVPERYRISGLPGNGDSFAAAVMSRDGLDMLVEVSEYGVRMYTYGRICAIAALLSAVAGMLMMLIPCLSGLWSVVSAANVLIYMLVWLLPMLLMLLDLKK